MSAKFKYPFNPIPWQAEPQDLSGDVAGTPYLGIYAAEATKRYVYGTRKITWDGRVYKYSKAGAAITTSNCDQLVHTAYSQHIDYGATIAKTTVAGATDFVVDIGASMGGADDGVIAEDELEAGTIIVYSDTIATIQRGIIGNDAVATGEMRIWVDGAIPVVLTTDASYAEGMCSPYLNVTPGDGNGLQTMVGMPQGYCDSGDYIWIQTWGPCWVAPQSTAGAAAHNTAVVARYDGSVQSHAYASAYNTLQQHVGFILSYAAAGTQGAPFIMLQISI